MAVNTMEVAIKGEGLDEVKRIIEWMSLEIEIQRRMLESFADDVREWDGDPAGALDVARSEAVAELLAAVGALIVQHCPTCGTRGTTIRDLLRIPCKEARGRR